MSRIAAGSAAERRSSGNDPSAAIGGTFLIAETACRFWQGPAGAAKNRPLCKDNTGDGFWIWKGSGGQNFKLQHALGGGDLGHHLLQ